MQLKLANCVLKNSLMLFF